jgi:hypothetical protein
MEKEIKELIARIGKQRADANEMCIHQYNYKRKIDDAKLYQGQVQAFDLCLEWMKNLAQNLKQAPVIKSVCEKCSDTGWYKQKIENLYANKCDCGK